MWIEGSTEGGSQHSLLLLGVLLIALRSYARFPEIPDYSVDLEIVELCS